jgi:hypothetical protein
MSPAVGVGYADETRAPHLTNRTGLRMTATGIRQGSSRMLRRLGLAGLIVVAIPATGGAYAQAPAETNESRSVPHPESSPTGSAPIRQAALAPPAVQPFSLGAGAALAAWLREAGYPQPDRPPLTSARVAGQIAAGAAGGAVGALVLAGTLAYAWRHDDEGWGALAGLGVGAFIGYPIGSTAGVQLAGEFGGRRGSLLATAAGSAAGAVAGALLGPVSGGLSYVVLVPVGGAIGFNITRRWR